MISITWLEILVLVFGTFLAIPFFIVELSQLLALVRSQRRLTNIWEKILEDPVYAGEVIANSISGILNKLDKDPNLKARILKAAEDFASKILTGKNAEKLFSEFVATLQQDPEKQKRFFWFFGITARNIMESLKESITETKENMVNSLAAVKFPKRHMLKPYENIINYALGREIEKDQETGKEPVESKKVADDNDWK